MRLTGAASRPAGPPAFDLATGVLLARVGQYPLHHGTVGAIRSLGRLGVPVHAIVEDRLTPAARSRYLSSYFRWSTTGREDPKELVDGLTRIGAALGDRTILVPTDEEAAVLVAEHGETLRDHFVMPGIERTLPRLLGSKHSLHSLCVQHGVPAPALLQPRSAAGLFEAAEVLGFPLVVKNDAPWARLVRPAVGSTAILNDPTELEQLARSWNEFPALVVQEYVPREHATDWIAHAYLGSEPDTHVIFTGRKLRSWPPRAGVTTYAYAHRNDELAELTLTLCQRVGFRGICDLDWRFDSRTGEYKLLDFNPRLGAQFRLFERSDGVDVLRAMHLDLTGRELGPGRQVDGRRYIVENLDLPAAVAYGRLRERQKPALPCSRRELAWWARDDPLPAVLGYGRSAAFAAKRLLAGGLGSYRVP